MTPSSINRVAQEAEALLCAFIPLHGNDVMKKLFAVVLLIVWCTVTIGDAFEYCHINMYWYGPLTAIIFTLFGRLWGLEYERIFKNN